MTRVAHPHQHRIGGGDVEHDLRRIHPDERGRSLDHRLGVDDPPQSPVIVVPDRFEERQPALDEIRLLPS